MGMIDIRAVQKLYGKTLAVRGIDCTIEAGEFVVILGPSGCGKSTLLRMIAGLEEISAGVVSIDGTIVNNLEPGERGCAMVFQNYALYPHMSVAQNIGYALKVAGVSKAERQRKVAAIADMLELGKLLDRKPGELSGGQRQRVAMGRAMIRSPKVFLFDEPLSNLDAKLRLQMRLEIKRLHRELRTTSIFVTHDQVEAMTLADKLIVMSEGRIEQIGSPGEVYQRPASRFVAEFLGAPPMNMFSGRIDAHGRVVLADGSEPCPATRWALSRGEDVVLGVRPSALRFTAPDTAGALPFTPELHEDLGSELHMHGTAAGMPVSISLSSGASVPDGPSHLLVPASALHLFAARDGRRVEPITEPTVPQHPIPLKGDSKWNARQLLSI